MRVPGFTMSLTLREAKDLFEAGDLASIHLKKPFGSSMSQIFIDCISIAQGSEMDSMVEKCLGLKRRTGFYQMGCSLPAETDVEFRERAERYCTILDQYTLPDYTPTPLDMFNAGTPPPPPCYHSWKRYQGLMEVFDYCEFCDKKRPK